MEPIGINSTFATDNDNVLAPLDWSNPSLSDYNAVNSGAGGPGFGVDVVEVVQQSHYVTALSTNPSDPR